ncbi:MAG: Methylxanthine N1-demethylase NdmA [Stenotrophomonas maltophilia]|nr:MAG: Methylxanthine N1-demethylase NdmA [Stenotrophomonas maltophilia]
MNWPRAIAEGWHPVATLAELGNKPLATRLLGQPLVLFRAGEQIGLLHDRCPHRGVPLSAGRVVDGNLACPYHGWRFDTQGECTQVPGARACAAAAATALPVRIEAGLVWTSLATQPGPFPVLPDSLADEHLDRFWWSLAASRAGLLDALENHLDPAHPHFVHPWLVRSPQRRRTVDVEVRSGPWGAQATYVEQRRNSALLPMMMEGQRARSIGRLWPPSIGEVRLESARGALLSIVVVFAPVDHNLTRPYAHFASTRGRLPAWFKRLALKAFHLPVLRQDRRLLALQAERGDPRQYHFGPLDVLARDIWRQANAEDCPEDVRQLQMEL